jgi:hypothetical protein
VQRDGRGGAGQPVDDGAVGELVEDVAGLARAGEAGEAGAAGADAPGRDGDGEAGDAGLDRVDVDAAVGEAVAEGGVVGARRFSRAALSASMEAGAISGMGATS